MIREDKILFYEGLLEKGLGVGWVGFGTAAQRSCWTIWAVVLCTCISVCRDEVTEWRIKLMIYLNECVEVQGAQCTCLLVLSLLPADVT